MTYSLRILPKADSDVDAVAGYIARDNLSAAMQFYNAVDATYRELRQHPNRWSRYELDHPRLIGLRKRSVKGFSSYLVFYHVVDRWVEIIRVLHGARDIPAALSDE